VTAITAAVIASSSITVSSHPPRGAGLARP
jgi:hypothetical protein